MAYFHRHYKPETWINKQPQTLDLGLYIIREHLDGE